MAAKFGLQPLPAVACMPSKVAAPITPGRWWALAVVVAVKQRAKLSRQLECAPGGGQNERIGLTCSQSVSLSANGSRRLGRSATLNFTSTALDRKSPLDLADRHLLPVMPPANDAQQLHVDHSDNPDSSVGYVGHTRVISQ
jgi:hypothetical protein